MFLPLLSALAISVPAPKEIKPSKSPPPMVMVVTVGKDGRAFVERTVIRYVPQTRTIEVKTGDKIEKREDMVQVPVQEVIRAFLDDKEVTVYDHKGQRIEAKDLPKRVTKTMPVLVSADGKEVDKFYLSIVREGTLIVAAPLLAVSPSPPIVDMPRKKP
jgi:hypothetical protein